MLGQMTLTQLPLSEDPLLARGLKAGERAWRECRLRGAASLLRLVLGRADARGDVAGALCAHQLLGHIALEQGDITAARLHHGVVLAQCQKLSLTLGEASALHNLGLTAAAASEAALARRLIANAVELYEAMGHQQGAAAGRTNLALLESL